MSKEYESVLKFSFKSDNKEVLKSTKEVTDAMQKIQKAMGGSSEGLFGKSMKDMDKYINQWVKLATMMDKTTGEAKKMAETLLTQVNKQFETTFNRAASERAQYERLRHRPDIPDRIKSEAFFNSNQASDKMQEVQNISEAMTKAMKEMGIGSSAPSGSGPSGPTNTGSTPSSGDMDTKGLLRALMGYAGIQGIKGAVDTARSINVGQYTTAASATQEAIKRRVEYLEGDLSTAITFGKRSKVSGQTIGEQVGAVGRRERVLQPFSSFVAPTGEAVTGGVGAMMGGDAAGPGGFAGLALKGLYGLGLAGANQMFTSQRDMAEAQAMSQVTDASKQADIEQYYYSKFRDKAQNRFQFMRQSGLNREDTYGIIKQGMSNYLTEEESLGAAQSFRARTSAVNIPQITGAIGGLVGQGIDISAATGLLQTATYGKGGKEAADSTAKLMANAVKEGILSSGLKETYAKATEELVMNSPYRIGLDEMSDKLNQFLRPGREGQPLDARDVQTAARAFKISDSMDEGPVDQLIANQVTNRRLASVGAAGNMPAQMALKSYTTHANMPWGNVAGTLEPLGITQEMAEEDRKSKLAEQGSVTGQDKFALAKLKSKGKNATMADLQEYANASVSNVLGEKAFTSMNEEDRLIQGARKAEAAGINVRAIPGMAGKMPTPEEIEEEKKRQALLNPSLDKAAGAGTPAEVQQMHAIFKGMTESLEKQKEIFSPEKMATIVKNFDAMGEAMKNVGKHAADIDQDAKLSTVALERLAEAIRKVGDAADSANPGGPRREVPNGKSAYSNANSATDFMKKVIGSIHQ